MASGRFEDSLATVLWRMRDAMKAFAQLGEYRSVRPSDTASFVATLDGLTVGVPKKKKKHKKRHKPCTL